MKDKHITLQAEGEFPFKFYIEKAIASEDGVDLIVEGVASTINVDHDNERMAPEALVSMARVINDKAVPLRIEHSKDGNAIVGQVFEAKVDERNQLWVKAILDRAHPAASILHQSLKDGVKLGLSVGGRVKQAIQEFVESQGKMVKTFYDVALDEVSVTTRPANYDAWLFAKSIIGENESADSYRNTGFYRSFLFENQQFDYIQTIAKSIPKESWHKVDMPLSKNNDMKKDKEEDKKDEETKARKSEDEKEEESEKSVSSSEFRAFKSMVTKGFESITSLLSKGMDTDAKDQENPDKKTDDPEANKAMDTDAKDTVNPDKDKDVPDTEKSADDEDKEDDEAKKSEDDKEDDKEEKKQDDEEGDEEMKSMSDVIKRLDKMQKGMKKSDEDEEEKEKSEDDEGDDDDQSEKTQKSVKISDMDKFAIGIMGVLESMQARMEKSGMRYPGLVEHFIAEIQNDPVMQKSIKEMLAQPGAKRSVVMGVPYMIEKSGKRYALTATPVNEKVEKSEMKGKSFKDVYKSNFSSVKAEE